MALDKPKPENRRKQRSFSRAVERFIDDAEKGRFPIKHRKRDCERVNWFAAELNRLHREGDPKGMQQGIAQMLRAVFEEEILD